LPLVFVHGVANRPGAEQTAATKQRDALFRSITFNRDDFTIFNPDWGSFAVKFTVGEPWLPKPGKIEAFAVGAAEIEGVNAPSVGLGEITKTDGVQAVDLAILAVLEQDILAASKNGAGAAPDQEVIRLAKKAAQYIAPNLREEGPKALAALESRNDLAFAEALSEELASVESDDHQAFGITDKIKEGVSALAGWFGNTTSDAVLRLKRQTLSHGFALFLGDIFVYLRQREVPGADGTRERLFAPIITDLISAAKVHRQPKEPFVVVGHSLGGVLLYDILTDPPSLEKITREVRDFRIDLWLTVGSQSGFFADLGLFSDKPRPAPKLKRPACVSNWLNVYDYTDVFSFLCAPFFEGVDDFGYDTKIDLFEAHSAYFKRPSFYKRLEFRLTGLGLL
jgi:hypothetical protein